eukprot:3166230-Lingulodinium_polyedra.AAC.1
MRHLSVCSLPGCSIRSAAASRARLLRRTRYPSSLAQTPAWLASLTHVSCCSGPYGVTPPP